MDKLLKFTGSISAKLFFLIILVVIPCVVIIVFSGIEQRNQLVEISKSDVLMLTDAIADAQQRVTLSTNEMLSMLSKLPSVQGMNPDESSAIFKSVLENNPTYSNIALVDLKGDVLASGKPYAKRPNLADREHVKKAAINKKFSAGEFIITRVGDIKSAFPFALPVLDREGRLKGVLTAVIKLDIFSHFYDMKTLPEKSFIAITDSKGIRLFYYPSQIKTNPIGKPIRKEIWEIVKKSSSEDIFTGSGSDGLQRFFAYRKIYLDKESEPYLYVWAGIPENFIFEEGNKKLARNLILMLSATAALMVLAWFFGQRSLVRPIKNLVYLTGKFSKGDFDARSSIKDDTGEIGSLTKAFNSMADALKENMLILQENEQRFRLVMDSLEAVVFVTDMNTHEVLFINRLARDRFGDVTGKICWQSFQKGLKGPCRFCKKSDLLDEEGSADKVCTHEVHNKLINKWLFAHERAIEWVDGRIVHLHVASDITSLKKIEKEREDLITQLQDALSEIKTLSGFLPICARCKKIRDDKGYWNQIETYIQEHSDAEFSHGLCPECSDELYGGNEWYKKIKEKKKNK